MTNAIRNDAGGCRTRQDEDDFYYGWSPEPNKEDERPTCSLDVDWNAVDTPAADDASLAEAYAAMAKAESAPPAKDDAALVAAYAAMAKANAPPAWTPTSNAIRTGERSAADGPYAAAGVTPDRTTVFAGAAAIKGKTACGDDIEVASISAQIGTQTEVQVGLLRENVKFGDNRTFSNEIGTASARLGVVNPDGSIGLNVGATATLVSDGATAEKGGFSNTTAVAVGVGADAHIGIRDVDHNGKPELCGQITINTPNPYMSADVGGCIELPWVIIKD